jgi:hypothetical protein
MKGSIMKRSAIIIGALVATVALVGCGSSSSKSSSSSTTSTTTTQDAVCSAKSELATSVKALADPTLLTGGKSGITAAVDTVKQNLDTLSAAAKADLQPDVDAMKSALTQLKASVSSLGDGAVGTGLTAVGTDITKVADSAGNLADALKTKCPSS